MVCKCTLNLGGTTAAFKFVATADLGREKGPSRYAALPAQSNKPGEVRVDAVFYPHLESQVYRCGFLPAPRNINACPMSVEQVYQFGDASLMTFCVFPGFHHRRASGDHISAHVPEF